MPSGSKAKIFLRALRLSVLQALHSAHQGTSGMTSRAYCSSMLIKTWNMDFLVTLWYNCHTFSLFSIDHEAIVYKILGCSINQKSYNLVISITLYSFDWVTC